MGGRLRTVQASGNTPAGKLQVQALFGGGPKKAQKKVEKQAKGGTQKFGGIVKQAQKAVKQVDGTNEMPSTCDLDVHMSTDDGFENAGWHQCISQSITGCTRHLRLFICRHPKRHKAQLRRSRSRPPKVCKRLPPRLAPREERSLPKSSSRGKLAKLAKPPRVGLVKPAVPRASTSGMVSALIGLLHCSSPQLGIATGLFCHATHNMHCILFLMILLVYDLMLGETLQSPISFFPPFSAQMSKSCRTRPCTFPSWRTSRPQ